MGNLFNQTKVEVKALVECKQSVVYQNLLLKNLPDEIIKLILSYLIDHSLLKSSDHMKYYNFNNQLLKTKSGDHIFTFMDCTAYTLNNKYYLNNIEIPSKPYLIDVDEVKYFSGSAYHKGLINFIAFRPLIITKVSGYKWPNKPFIAILDNDVLSFYNVYSLLKIKSKFSYGRCDSNNKHFIEWDSKRLICHDLVTRTAFQVTCPGYSISMFTTLTMNRLVVILYINGKNITLMIDPEHPSEYQASDTDGLCLLHNTCELLGNQFLISNRRRMEFRGSKFKESSVFSLNKLSIVKTML